MIFSLLCCVGGAFAKEGMWIPATIKNREKDMKAMGLEIPADILYNSVGSGLNNAVVLFGRGCTGEIISPKGLLITNHHCGYGSAKRLSSAGKDFFSNGFWAQNQSEELPCPGLTVTFVRKMEDVSSRIINGLADTLADNIRDSIIATRIAMTEKEYSANTHLDATIKAYFTGNQYWVALTETYRDVRLVCFPPNIIGAFGGYVENWMWPRHTGDFCLFRVYAGADNKPADYSASNNPYEASRFFNINISGYKEGDFTMVYGFPGATQEYISSYELNQVYSITYPISVAARTRKLDVWNKHMGWNQETFIKYSAKRAGVADGWKKWQGEVQGMKVNKVTEKKQAAEKLFQKWADTAKSCRFAAKLLPQMSAAAQNADKLLTQEQYNKECPLAVELVAQGGELERMLKCMRLNLSETELNDTLKKVANDMAGFFKNYDALTDKDVFISLMALYFSKCANNLPVYYQAQYKAHNQDLKAWADEIYSASLLISEDRLKEFAAHARAADSVKILNDAAWQLNYSLNTLSKEKISPALKEYTKTMRHLNRLYMEAQMAMNKKNAWYPDANLTLRLSYGKIKSLKTDIPGPSSFMTRLSDVVKLDDTTSDIFKVPARLKQLYNKKDFGRWAVKGDVPVAFLAVNHTTGGNSGSPVLNKKGELIGTNFDRPFEGTMSDYYFDPNRCRNISVDIRYTLFIIEKFGNAGWLLNEMKLVGK